MDWDSEVEDDVHERLAALQVMLTEAETKIREQHATEQALRQELKDHEAMYDRDQALLRDSLEAKISFLEQQLQVEGNGTFTESHMDLALGLRAAERRLREQEVMIRQQTDKLHDLSVQLKVQGFRLKEKENLEGALQQAKSRVAEQEDTIEALHCELRHKDLQVSEAMAKAAELLQTGPDPLADAREMIRTFNDQLDKELQTVRGDLQTARGQLQTTHAAAMRAREDIVVLDMERESKRVDLKALDAELETKRETLIRLETEQVGPTESKVAMLKSEQMRLGVKIDGLQEQTKTKEAEVCRLEAQVRALHAEVKTLEENCLDLRRKTIFLNEEWEEKTSQVKLLSEDISYKQRMLSRLTRQMAETSRSPVQSPVRATKGKLELLDTSFEKEAPPEDAEDTPIDGDEYIFVTVADAKGLFGNGSYLSKAHPFLAVQMGTQTKRTRVVRNTIQPQWNETFCFKLTNSKLTLTLWNHSGPNMQWMGAGYICADPPLISAISDGPVRQWVPLVVRESGGIGGVNIVLQAMKKTADGLLPVPTAVADPTSPLSDPSSPISPNTEPSPALTTRPTDTTVVAKSATPSATQRQQQLPSTKSVGPVATASKATSTGAPEKLTSSPSSEGLDKGKSDKRTPYTGGNSPWVDYHESTPLEPSLHFKEPDIKYLRIRLYEGVVPVMDFDGQCDPFLLVNTGLMTWKSSVAKETLTPVWNQEVVMGCYNLEHMSQWGIKLPEELRKDIVQMTVYNWNPAVDRRIGFIDLNFKDLPGYDTDEIVDPPEPFWFEARRHSGVLTSLVSSEPGKWVTSLMFNKKMKKMLKEQQAKLAAVREETMGKPDEEVQGLQSALEFVSKTALSTLKQVRKEVRARALQSTEEDDDDEDDETAEDALRGAHGMCSIKMQVWFDNTYIPPPTHLVGQLHFRIHSTELELRDFGQPRSPLVVLNYGRHWVRLPTVFGNVHSVFDQEFTFGVTEPAHVLTMAVFDDISDRIIGGEAKFLGLIRIRPCCLSTNTWHRAALPLYQRTHGHVRLRGRVNVSACLRLSNTIPIVLSMFKPPLREQAYYMPLNEFESDFDRPKSLGPGPHSRQEIEKEMEMEELKKHNFEIPIKVGQYERLLEIVEEQDNGWNRVAMKKILTHPTPEFDIPLLKANFQRLMEAFKLGSQFAEYVDYICQWKSVRDSLTVNIGLVVFVCFIEWAPTFCLFWLLFSFIKGFYRHSKQSAIAPMESTLFGDVIDGMKREANEEEEEGDTTKKPKKDDDSSPFKELDELKQMAIEVQTKAGEVASLVERLQSMPRFNDPRISALMSIIFAILIPGLYYIPLKLVVSLAILFVLRHPILRDPIPPPPVNLIERLPSRAELMLPASSI